MSIHLIFGILLLPGGLVSLYFGLQASQSTYHQHFASFSKSLIDSTAWLLVGGFMSMLGGLILITIHSFHQYSLYTDIFNQNGGYYAHLLLQ